jgi:hypothetical protein
VSEQILRTGEFALTVTDYVSFTLFTANRSQFRRRTGRWLALFAVGPLAVAIDLAIGIHPELYLDAGGVTGLVILALCIGALLVALSVFTDPIMLRLAARRRFRDGSFAAFIMPQTIDISTAGVRFAGLAGEGLTPWSSIVAVASNEGAVYLFLNSLSAYIVKRRAFADSTAFDGFLSRARELHGAERDKFLCS